MTIARRLRGVMILLSVTPLVVVVLFFGLTLSLSIDSEEVTRMFREQRWIETQLMPAIARGEVPPAPPDDAWAIAIGPDDRVLYSSVAVVPVGSTLDVGDAAVRRQLVGRITALAGGDRPISVGLRAVDRPDGAMVRVVHRALPPPPQPLSLTRRVIVLGSTLLVLLIIGGVTGTLVVRALRDRFATIQAGIHQVAAGDLSRPIIADNDDEFGELARELDSMRGTLRENRERRSRFLMAVSHDLGTPLTTINGYLEAILDDVVASPDDIRDAARAMRAKSEVLRERIEELIEFVRLESGEWRLRLEEIEVGGYVDTLCATFAGDAAAMGKRFSASVDLEGGLVIRADRRLMDRAFENLFHNALRYTDDNGAIALEARSVPAGGATRAAAGERAAASPGDRQVVVVLSDNGPGFGGIEPEELFEPFRRGSRGRNEPGFGLGLSTVRSVLQAHGYEISARETDSGGARFEIVLTGVATRL